MPGAGPGDNLLLPKTNCKIERKENTVYREFKWEESSGVTLTDPILTVKWVRG